MQTHRFGVGEARDAFAPTGFDRSYWRAVQGSRAISRMTSRVDLPDAVELPTDRPAIIAANHSSWFDLVASLITLGHYGVTARIGVGSRFFENPVAGWFLRGIGCIPFSRDDREQAERTMIEALEAGQVCAIMPEGKITKPADRPDGVGPGRPGVSRIARRTGAAVVPVGFARSDEAWKPGKAVPGVHLGRRSVTTSIGPPILFTDDDHDANVSELMDRIGALVRSG